MPALVNTKKNITAYVCQGTKKTEVSKPSNTCKQIQQTSNINIMTETMTGLPQHNRDKFIKFSSTGILNHYGPTFRNIKKDLERLNIRQEVLSVDISTETTKLRQGCIKVMKHA